MPISGFPTPDMPENEVGFICKPIFVPDIPELWATLYGQITELTREYYWKQAGTMTPAQAAFLWARALAHTDLDAFCSDEESDDCVEYPTNADFITYLPKDPYTGIGDDTGYLLPPFIRFGDILPDMLLGFAEELTGYQPNDILTLLGSLPIGLDFDEILTALENGLPRVQIQVNGSGRVLIHFVLVPFGGRVLISLDDPLNIAEIFTGLITDGYRTIELERDLSSFPPEDDSDHIEEIEFDTEGAHTIYLYFVPAINDALAPVGFGGGIRSIEVCLNDESDIMIDCGYIQDCVETSPNTAAGDSITWANMREKTVNWLDPIEDAWTGTPQDVFIAIPSTAPDTDQQAAMCEAIGLWVRLYAQVKIGEIRNKNFFAQAWSALVATLSNLYHTVNGMLGTPLTPDLWSCIASDSEAIAVLSDAGVQNEVICCLYEHLKDDIFSVSLVEGALSDCVTELTGDANLFACTMEQDFLNDVHVLISFCEAYALTLEFQTGGAIFEDCLCGSYPSMIEYDFSIDDRGFTSVQGNYVTGEYWQGVAQTVFPPTSKLTVLDIKKLIGTGAKVVGIGFQFSAETDCGITSVGARVNLDGSEVGGFGTSPTFSGTEIYRTYGMSMPDTYLTGDEIEFVLSGRLCNGVQPIARAFKIRVWLHEDSVVKGVEVAALPYGTGANGTNSMDWWT